jgi:hypothetical protein
MADFHIRSDSVNVEQIMEQIRARIREKRGVDYTEQQIRELAAVKLEKFLDPRGVRSDLLEQFRKAQPPGEPLDLPNYSFESSTLFESHRPIVRFIRRLLLPILKLFFNPNPLIQALHIQARLNSIHAGHETAHRATHHLYYELIHNLVVETTRLAIEVKNLKMRVESLASRLEFNERRARALESVVAYRPSAGEVEERTSSQAGERPAAVPPAGQPAPQPASPLQPVEGPGQRSRKRRRRRGRRGAGAAATAGMAGPAAAPASPDESVSIQPEASDEVSRDDFENLSGSASHRTEPLAAEGSTSDADRPTPRASDAGPSERTTSDTTPPTSMSEPEPPVDTGSDDNNSQ